MSIKISELPEASTVGSTDIVPIVQNGETKKTQARNIKPDVFTGTDGVTAGTSGLVPAPQSTDRDRYLKSDGTWGEVTSTGESIIEIEDTSVRIWDLNDGIYHLPDNCEIYYKGATNTSVIIVYSPVYLTVTVNTESDETNTRRDWYYVYQNMNEPYIRYGSTTSSNGTEYNKKLITYTKSEIDTLLDAKQDALTPGSNISIVENVIATIGDTIPQLNDDFVYIYQLEPGAYHLKRDGSIRVRYMTGRDFTVTGDAWLFVTTNQTAAPLTWLLIETATRQINITTGYTEKSGGGGSYKRTYPDYIESTQNKVTTLSSSSTNDQYTGAKLVYDELVQRDEAIAELEEENEQLLEQIPTATAEGETINVQDSSNLPIKDFALLGNAEQTPTTWQYVGTLSTGNYKFTIDNVDYYFTSNSSYSVNATFVFNKATMKITEDEIMGIEMSVSTTALTSTTTITFSAPTPDNPVPINVVTGDNTVEVVGKNFFDKSTITTAAYIRKTDGEIVTQGAGYYAITDYIPINQTLAYSGCHISSSYASGGAFYDSSKTFISGFSMNNSGIVTPVENAAYVRFTIRTSNGDQDTFQVEYGSTATTYEPYTEQSQLLSLGSIELAKIPNTDYKDRIYKQDGKWWLEKNTGRKVLDGTEQNWGKGSSTSYDKFVLNYGVYKQDSNSLCNYFAYSQADANGTWHNNQGVQLVFDFEVGTMTSLDAFQTWASTHNIILYQPLKTPTTTEITDTTLLAQLENILAMHTNKNVTNAWIEPSGTNAQAGLTLTYRKDLQTLTDKISNLEARISLLE